MKVFLLKYTAVFALVMVSGGLLMNVSQRVQSVERKIARYDLDIDREEEAIRVLKAEWAFLNNPARLEELVSGDSDLEFSGVEKLVSDVQAIPDISPDISSVFPARSPLYRDISHVPTVYSSFPMIVPVKPSRFVKSSSSPNHQEGHTR